LLASGTIPLVCVPVRDIAGAPHGNYWDGALIDYHLLLPYPWLATHKRTDRSSIVLYRHFDRSVTPGWLDKHLPWRRSSSGHAWLANVLNRAIGVDDRAYPNRKLPDRRHGSRGTRARLEPRHRRERALRRGGAAIDGAAGSDDHPPDLAEADGVSTAR
jgi:hypothetical protein